MKRISIKKGKELPFVTSANDADTCTLEASICESSPASDDSLDIPRFEVFEDF